MTRRTLLFASIPAWAWSAQSKRNVLFLVVDDLRPQMGCYGNRAAITPHMDRLASQGVMFTHAYCQQAVCNPSRSSVLTGRRPDTIRVWDLKTHFRDTLPDVTTLPQYFKRHGYDVRGFGKIYHDGLNDLPSWSAPAWPELNAGMQYVDEEKLKLTEPGAPIPTVTWKKRRSWQAPDVPDNALQDGQAADRAIRALEEMRDRPFFLAVGFQKPHLPFVAPKKYWDLYRDRRPATPDIPAPHGVPEIALHPWTELRGYTDIPRQGSLPPGKAAELVLGYYAAMTYTDAQVGRVLETLDRNGLARNTVVILWGDHGFHLGEHNLWAKTTNFELDTRSPLIVRAPGVPSARCDRLVELVDIYPTLVELCGLPLPGGLDGASMKPLLSDPRRPWKKAVYSQFPRGDVMGYSMRTDRFRLTRWVARNGEERAMELYDHDSDPNETVNLADRAQSRNLVEDLKSIRPPVVPQTNR